uniref:Uncharacterized protein n=1 Tax=Grammatophora oceanica TaxID=210454 RepID=A0A7S1Y2M6_9STRA|mmetsp:Transcript_13119/g.19340  ORF Transcript_13119/g.19340 Transcript_13119/m.19340 type:complete len:277 (+) Transcript_13119:37-867(+)
MGQSSSKSIAKTVHKTVSRIQEQAAKATVSATPPPSQKERDDGGFQRGGGPTSSADTKQLEHLRRHQQYGARTVPSATESPSTELDPELLSFLQEQGPLERKVDKDFTSKRLLRESLKPLDEADQVSPVDKRRITEETPISAFDTQHTTKRTSNFSRGLSPADLEDQKRFGLEADEIFNLLAERDSHEAENMSHEDELLVQQTKAVLGVPAILRDLDNSYVGAWPENVPKLQLLKLQPVRKNQIMLSVEAWQVRESSVMSRMASRSQGRTPKSEDS